MPSGAIRIRGYSLAIGVIQKQESKDASSEDSEGKKQDEGKLEIKDLKVAGTAVIKKGKLTGFLDHYETRGLLFAIDEIQSGIINVDNPLEEGKKVAFEIVQSSGIIKGEVKDDELKLMIEVKASGRMDDQQGKGDLTTPEMVKEMENRVEAVIKKNIRDAVDKAQQDYQSDFFRFVKIVYGDYYEYWEKIKDNWEEVFSNAPVEIKVQWTTNSSSLIKRSGQPYTDGGNGLI